MQKGYRRGLLVVERDRRAARALMRQALDLLDRAGESLAAARLQHAIDSMGSEASLMHFPAFTPPEDGSDGGCLEG